jgi:hypothetical protein
MYRRVAKEGPPEDRGERDSGDPMSAAGSPGPSTDLDRPSAAHSPAPLNSGIVVPWGHRLALKREWAHGLET